MESVPSGKFIKPFCHSSLRHQTDVTVVLTVIALFTPGKLIICHGRQPDVTGEITVVHDTFNHSKNFAVIVVFGFIIFCYWRKRYRADALFFVLANTIRFCQDSEQNDGTSHNKSFTLPERTRTHIEY
jgi:hypothetical protein